MLSKSKSRGNENEQSNIQKLPTKTIQFSQYTRIGGSIEEPFWVPQRTIMLLVWR